MIKIYCQYSFGGFKTLYIEGKENELLDKEVTINESYGMPDEAYVYFQFRGAMLVYRQLNDGHLALVVKEIPSIHTDSDGRAINCAVLFIGDLIDRKTFDNLAIVIANDLVWFGNFFSNLFSGRGGLHIMGDKLREFINIYSKDIKFSGKSLPQLLNISKKKSGVFLFIPLSSNFGIDSNVTKRVCDELRFDIKDLNGVTVSMKTILEIQKTLSITVIERESKNQKDEPKKLDEVQVSVKEVNKDLPAQNDMANLMEQLNKITIKERELTEELQSIKSQLSSKSNEVTILSYTLSSYKKIIMGLAALCLILLICLLSTCSENNDKQNINNYNETEINQPAYK